jgi:hypothetical protein
MRPAPGFLVRPCLAGFVNTSLHPGCSMISGSGYGVHRPGTSPPTARYISRRSFAALHFLSETMLLIALCQVCACRHCRIYEGLAGPQRLLGLARRTNKISPGRLMRPHTCRSNFGTGIALPDLHKRADPGPLKGLNSASSIYRNWNAQSPPDKRQKLAENAMHRLRKRHTPGQPPKSAWLCTSV